MAIDITTLSPAVLKAKEVATESYTDNVVKVVTDNIYAPNTTTIDGGKITTNTLIGDRIKAGTSINAPVVNGGEINGVLINGAVIKGSYFDFSTTAYLTNWKYYTPSSPPPVGYRDNYAKNADGTLQVDSGGYYRLVTTDPVYSQYNSQSISCKGQNDNKSSTTAYSNVHTYDYQQVYAKKLINNKFTINLVNPVTLFTGSADCYGVGEYRYAIFKYTFNFFGDTVEIEGRSEKNHYSDVNVNHPYLKVTKNGSVLFNKTNQNQSSNFQFNLNGVTFSIDYLLDNYTTGFSSKAAYNIKTTATVKLLNLNGVLIVPSSFSGDIFTCSGNATTYNYYSSTNIPTSDITVTLPVIECGKYLG